MLTARSSRFRQAPSTDLPQDVARLIARQEDRRSRGVRRSRVDGDRGRIELAAVVLLMVGCLGPLAVLFWPVAGSDREAPAALPRACEPGRYRDPVTGLDAPRPDFCRPVVAISQQ